MNTPSPLVSIVVPAYNAARYIDETVQSLLAQTYSNLEIILIDDGSSDQTFTLLQRYADRCVVASHSNKGQAATLNLGWQRARGQIIGYLSADDRLLPDAVASAVAVLTTRPDIALVYPDYALIDEESRPLKVVLAPEYSYAGIVLRGECPIGPGAFFRRMLFDRTGGWDTTLRQIPDYEFWLRAGLYGSMHRLDQVLAQFRVHSGSQTFAEPSVAKANEYQYVMEKYFARPDVPAEFAAKRQIALGNAYLLTARLHLRAGRFHMAFSAWRQAVRSNMWAALRPRSVKLILNGILGRQLHYAKLWLRRALGNT